MEIDEARIAKAKSLGAKYVVEIDGEDKVIFLKEPSKLVYQAWYSTYSNDATSANETVVRTLAIKEVSDMDVLDDYKALGSIFGKLSDIMALKKSTLKTL